MKNSIFILGWKMSIIKVNYGMLLLLCMSFSSYAEEQKQNNGTKPSMELLEFLGEWQTQDGQWFDPMQFDADANANANTNTNTNVSTDHEDKSHD